MTVTSGVSRVVYNGDGVSVAFPVPFYFLGDDHLGIVKRLVDGSEVTLVLGTDYTVSGVGDPSGGAVTTTIAPAVGERLAIFRTVPLTQETDYQSNDPFPEESHERALDKQMMGLQQVADGTDRTLKLGVTDTDGAGAYRANGNRITDLAAPTTGGDAVRKSDLDAAITGAGVTPLPYVELAEITPPATPGANNLRIYAKDVGGETHLVTKDGGGLEVDLHDTQPQAPQDTLRGRISVGTGVVENLNPAQARQVAGAAALGETQQFAGNQRMGVTTLVGGAVITPDLSANNLFSLFPDQNFTLANPSNQAAGQSGAVRIQQDITGSRVITWGSHWKFPNGVEPLLSTAPAAVDRLDYLVWSNGEIHAALAKAVA